MRATIGQPTRWHVRCSGRACQRRRVLAKHPDDYKRPPACPACGGRRYTVDPWMMRRNTRLTGCLCAGYNFGGAYHRRGSLKCWYRADGTAREPGDPDFYDEGYDE